MRITTVSTISILVVSILTLISGMVLGATDQDTINDTENVDSIEDVNNQTNDTEGIVQPDMTFVEKTDIQTSEETIVPKPTKSPGFGYIISIAAIISLAYMFGLRKK